MNDSIVMLYRNGVFFKSFLLFTKIVLPLQPHFAKTYIWAAARFRKIGRVIECAGLEIRYTPFGYRGFESLIFRREGIIEPGCNVVRRTVATKEAR